MSEDKTLKDAVKEAVGTLAGRSQVQAAVAALQEAGFEPSDLSLLSSHESIAAADTHKNHMGEIMDAMGGDLKYLGPLAAAGFIMLASGPLAAVLAGIIAAGVGGLAIKELLEESVATSHSDDFARALEAGSVILWVRVETEEQEKTALAIFKENGGENIHVNERRRAE